MNCTFSRGEVNQLNFLVRRESVKQDFALQLYVIQRVYWLLPTKKKWQERVSGLFNPPWWTSSVVLATLRLQRSVICDPPTRDELIGIFKQLKDFRVLMKTVFWLKLFYKKRLTVIHELFVTAWGTECCPENYSTFVLLPSTKRDGDYRGISLIDESTMILSSLLLVRFSAEHDQWTCPNQSGFRLGRRSTLDHLPNSGAS